MRLSQTSEFYMLELDIMLFYYSVSDGKSLIIFLSNLKIPSIEYLSYKSFHLLLNFCQQFLINTNLL